MKILPGVELKTMGRRCLGSEGMAILGMNVRWVKSQESGRGVVPKKTEFRNQQNA